MAEKETKEESKKGKGTFSKILEWLKKGQEALPVGGC